VKYISHIIIFIALTFQFTVSANEWIIEESAKNPSEIQIQQFVEKLDQISIDSPEELIQVEFMGQDKNKSAYPAGDLYILLGIGKKDEQMTKTEYTSLWKIMNYLSDKGFRVMMNVKAKVAHLEDAINSTETSLIMFSGHGNKTGFYDYNSNRIPSDIFSNAHKSLYQFVLSSCYGRLALNSSYSMPSHIKTWAWSGLTNSKEFINFLVSDDWSATAGKN
jgi:hypothetical protein